MYLVVCSRNWKGHKQVRMSGFWFIECTYSANAIVLVEFFQYLLCIGCVPGFRISLSCFQGRSKAMSVMKKSWLLYSIQVMRWLFIDLQNHLFILFFIKSTLTIIRPLKCRLLSWWIGEEWNRCRWNLTLIWDILWLTTLMETNLYAAAVRVEDNWEGRIGWTLFYANIID